LQTNFIKVTLARAAHESLKINYRML